jgi:hypothetical protein
MSEQKVDTAAGRDGQGRFAAGNPGGPGNTSARRVAQLRRRLLSRITDEEMDAIFDKLIELAKDGDLTAIKLVLQYTVGKPGPASELDLPSLADPEPQASGGRQPPEGRCSPRGADTSRSPAPPRDLMRQIEQALQPQTLVNLPPAPPAMAPSQRR